MRSTAAAEEMSFVVMRSARSPLLREAGDLSSAITDHKGDLIAQGRDIPIHLGVMSFTVKKFLERVPAERLRPRRRLVPQPARGRRQPSARREGHPADLPGRPAVRLRRQPGPLGRHRRRLGGQLFRRRHRDLAGRRAHPAVAPLHGRRHRRGETRLPAGQPARPRGARGRSSWPRWRRHGRPRVA